MSKLVNIVVLGVWLLSQLLLASHGQAHSAMKHQHHSDMVTQTAPDGDHHVHRHADKQHSHDKKSASSDEGVPVKMPHSVDECCDTACQSATVLNSAELSAPLETSARFGLAVRSASCWSPGFVNPPPNSAA